MSAKPAATPLVPFERVAVAQPDRGKRVKQRDYLAEGSIPVIDQGQSPVGGYTNDDDFAFIGELPVVLFGDHTRAVKLVDQRFAVGADGIKIFRPAEGVRAKYLYYWMKSAPLPDRGYGRHYQYLRQLSLPLPPPKQQDEIVAELEKQFSRLDDAVANLKRVKAKLKRYKAAVLKAAVEGRLVETEAEIARREDRNYETGAQLLQRTLETRRSLWKGKGKYKEPSAPDTANLHELPKGWVWVSFEQACFAVSDEGKKLARSLYELNGALPVIDQGEEEFGGYTNELALEFSGSLPVIAFGDHTRRFKLVRTRFVVGADGVKLIGFGPTWVPEFLWFQFQTLEFEDRGYSRHFQFVRNKPLKLPPICEQHRIVAEIERCLSIAQTTAQEVASLERRAGILRSATLGAMLCPDGVLP